MPSAETLSILSGQAVTTEQATTVVAVVTSLARSYTRGNGFEDELPEDLETVVTLAAIRLLMNPTGVESESMGGMSVTFGKQFLGWSLGELAVLNRYRERAK